MIKIIEAFFIFVLAIVLIVGYNVITTPFPYTTLKATVVPPTGTSGPVAVRVQVFRTALCPYNLERTIFDSKGNKVLDEVLYYSTPKKLGAVSFIAPVEIGLETMAEGTANYNVRICSKCNIYQQLVPNCGQWLHDDFEVTAK